MVTSRVLYVMTSSTVRMCAVPLNSKRQLLAGGWRCYLSSTFSPHLCPLLHGHNRNLCQLSHTHTKIKTKKNSTYIDFIYLLLFLLVVLFFSLCSIEAFPAIHLNPRDSPHLAAHTHGKQSELESRQCDLFVRTCA